MSRSPSPLSARSRSRSRTASPDPETEACPFLIRVFVTKGKHTPLADFDAGKFPLTDEFTVYGWPHSTPTSLVSQLFSVFPAPYRSSAARFTFRHVYVDASERGLYRSKELVSFSGRDFMASVGPLTDSAAVVEKSLDGYGFLVGDLLSVAITIPEPRIKGAAKEGIPPGRGNTRDWPRGRDAPRDAHRDAPPHVRGRWDRDAPRGDSWRAGSPPRSRSPQRRESWSKRW